LLRWVSSVVPDKKMVAQVNARYRMRAGLLDMLLRTSNSDNDGQLAVPAATKLKGMHTHGLQIKWKHTNFFAKKGNRMEIQKRK
jgi:hypothetical protein